jgi:hypothetical protein
MKESSEGCALNEQALDVRDDAEDILNKARHAFGVSPIEMTPWPDHTLETKSRLDGQSDGSGIMWVRVATGRTYPATVAEVRPWPG